VGSSTRIAFAMLSCLIGGLATIKNYQLDALKNLIGFFYSHIPVHGISPVDK
jgi:thiosulfate reductase cytochrome b subunit